MTSKQRFLATLAALATSSAMFVGCGGGPQCGDGTREVDGECILSGPIVTCGEGTVVQNGACVVDPSSCPAGTSFDAEVGACVSTADVCGAGTTYDSGTGTCVPSSSIVCGEGTTEQNGTCVSTGGGGAECATGTTLVEGRCIVSPAACTGGTSLDAATNTCVLSDEACAAGLALAEGVCVPTAEVCGAGAQFSEDTGLCLPEAGCREGDVVLDGLCVPPAEALAADPNAISIDGEDVTIGNLPAVGERAIFTGTLEAYDEDGDASFDFDSFTFTGTAGQWVKISVQSLGAPSPGFIVAGPEDAAGNSSYERLSSLGIENDPARLLLLPESGEYTVLVLSGYALASIFAADDLDFFTTSSPEFGYVGTIEQLDAPTPTQITATDDPTTSETMSGTNVLRLDENFFSVAGAEADSYLTLNFTELQANVFGILQLWNTDGTFIEAVDVAADLEVLRPLPETGMHMVMDWYLTTTPGSSFTIETLIPDLIVAPAEVPAGSEIVIDFTDAPANSVIAARLAPDITGSLRVSVLDAGGDVLGTTTALSGAIKHYAFYSAGGNYSLRLENTGTTDINGQVLVEYIIPETLGNLSADLLVSSADIMLAGRSDNFFLVEDSRAGDVLGFSHANVDEAVLTYTVHDINGAIVVDSEAQGTDSNFVRHYSTTGGPALVQVRNNSALTREVTMGGQRWTPVDLPEAGLPGFEEGDTITYEDARLIAEDDSAFLRVRFDENVRISGAIEALTFGDLDFLVWDLDLNYIAGSFDDGDEYISALLLEAGTYLFEIYAFEELSGGFSLDMTLGAYGNVLRSNDENIDPGSATVIPSLTEITLTGRVSDHIGSNDNWWRFTVPAGDPLALTFTLTNAGGVGLGSMLIIDNNGNDVTINAGFLLGAGETSTVGAVFQPGQTYYVIFTGFLNNFRDPAYLWDYVVDIDEINTVHALERESNDDFASANSVALGTGMLGTIIGFAQGFESDFFSFVVTESGDYSLDILSFPNADDVPEVTVFLYDETQTPLVLDAAMSASLDPGTYYVEVTKSEYTGDANSYLLFINQN